MNKYCTISSDGQEFERTNLRKEKEKGERMPVKKKRRNKKKKREKKKKIRLV